MKTIEKVNTIALSGLFPGPATFWHRHMWDKIHDVFYAHNKKGIPTSASTPNMIINEVYDNLRRDGFLELDT
jgi:hypothetical protein